MANIAQRAEQQQEGEKTILGALFAMPFQFIGVMFGSLLGAIIIEWFCMYVFWPDEGWKHAQRMFEYELGWLSQDLMQSVMIKEPGRTAVWLTQTVYEWLVVKAGLQESVHELIEYAHTPTQYQVGKFDLRYEMNRAMMSVQDYALAALYTALTFCVRVVILTLTTPLFVLAAFTGLIDGLVQRDLRKFGHGTESSYLYHKAREAIIPLAITPWAVYLVIPVSLNPLIIMLPSSVALGVAIRVTISAFKKYI
ncbi:TIGR03747 family integrating conjugative element membrane protein [Pseudomonas azotoformans]|uniref:Integrating conjugative element membrane protein n=1 Tax=Pseudomonas azotoformans TaxID=47878 RepID=A0A127HQS5_PSEAZ|nr:TIGR03747 family integrating conjugative element membrane protein [Pseudomonas azotoformans]AMN76870.1 hypothetical protein AYR47_00335 [Pseudomonas azotoformans]